MRNYAAPWVGIPGTPTLCGVGLNEDCWLGINAVARSYGGANYQQTIVAYVDELTAHGMYAILDLHWSAPGVAPATSLRQMPTTTTRLISGARSQRRPSITPNVLFDAFNEPFGVDEDCWRDGCAHPSGPDTGPWQTAGMQLLVNTIRAAGARQPILLAGLAFANDMSEWRSHRRTTHSINWLRRSTSILSTHATTRCAGTVRSLHSMRPFQ
jgi:hypothetical protein